MGIFDRFKRSRMTKNSTWSEFGGYQSIFTNFGGDIYSASIVRACIRPIADFTSKAEIRCSDKQLERLLNYRPNLYMNGREFLKKIRLMYEIQNNVFIYIMRDDSAKVVGLYPIPYQTLQAFEFNNRVYVKFTFADAGKEPLTVSWDDLAVLRKDYFKSDIAADNNQPILQNLQLDSITQQGLANAVRATANLRGILKNTKAMLSDEDVKKRQQAFVRDYMSLENEGGIASIDATQEFTPITMSPIVTTYTQMKEIRENIYRYFGVNDKVMQGTMTSDEIEAFCELKVIPFLADLSTELTSKIFTGKSIAYDSNWIEFNINKLQFATLSTKLSMTSLVDRGAMTPNEWRHLFGLDDIEGGDELIRRLDTAQVEDEADNGTDEEPQSNTTQSDNDNDNNMKGEEDGTEE